MTCQSTSKKAGAAKLLRQQMGLEGAIQGVSTRASRTLGEVSRHQVGTLLQGLCHTAKSFRLLLFSRNQARQNQHDDSLPGDPKLFGPSRLRLIKPKANFRQLPCILEPRRVLWVLIVAVGTFY